MIQASLRLLGVLICVPAFAQVSQSVPDQLAPRQHGPIRDKSEHRDGTTTSSNWSGYAATGTGFTSALGTWVVPTVNCTGVNEDQYASSWVGIDGYSSSSVEQLGTDSDCVGSQPSYYAWYEFYPAPSYLIPLTVRAGDVITASVTYSSTTKEFTITLTDGTTPGAFTKSATVSRAQRSSAEWILESPCCTKGGSLPFPNFGTANFGPEATGTGNDSASETNLSGVISAFAPNYWLIQKTASSTSPQTSTCTGLFIDGASFNCTYGAPASGGGHHNH